MNDDVDLAFLYSSVKLEWVLVSTGVRHIDLIDPIYRFRIQIA